MKLSCKFATTFIPTPKYVEIPQLMGLQFTKSITHLAIGFSIVIQGLSKGIVLLYDGVE
jgi:hypothetical protein